MVNSQLDNVKITFIVHFLAIRYVKSHIVVSKLRKAELDPSDVFDFNEG